MAAGDIFREDEVGGGGQRAVIEVLTTSGRKSYALAALTLAGGGGGDASAANQVTSNTRIGDVTEAAPASDTASSGLNGRLQRIAQRITSLIALLPASLGIKTAAGSLSIAPASDAQFVTAGTEYETVAASQTAQALGATGAAGDLLNGLLVIPATTSPGAVTILDNAISIPVFIGGASSVSTLIPFFIPLGIKSVSGAWKVTTGTNVSVIGVGDFT